jgi:diadenosine tetraphosphate (Ap4A) HIT family hydrolase
MKIFYFNIKILFFNFLIISQISKKTIEKKDSTNLMIDEFSHTIPKKNDSKIIKKKKEEEKINNNKIIFRIIPGIIGVTILIFFLYCMFFHKKETDLEKDIKNPEEIIQEDKYEKPLHSFRCDGDHKPVYKKNTFTSYGEEPEPIRKKTRYPGKIIQEDKYEKTQEIIQEDRYEKLLQSFRFDGDHKPVYKKNTFTSYGENPQSIIEETRYPGKLIAYNNFAVAFKNNDPFAECHILVIPRKRHINIIDFIKNATEEELIGFNEIIKEVIEKFQLENKGFNIRVNTHHCHGQTMFHYHMHIRSKNTRFKFFNLSQDHNKKNNMLTKCCTNENYQQKQNLIIDQNDFNCYKVNHRSSKSHWIIEPQKDYKEKYKDFYDFLKKATRKEQINFYKIMQSLIEKEHLNDKGFNIHINNKESHGQNTPNFHCHILCDK